MKIHFPLLLAFLTFSLCFMCPLAAPAEDTMKLKFDGDSVSLQAKDAPLKALLEKLKEEKGIWYKADQQLLETKITAEFKGLSLEEALKRALSELNYSLTLDPKKNIKGITVAGRLKPTQSESSGKGKAAPTLPPPAAASANQPPFVVIPNAAPPENPNAKPIDTTVRHNSPPPGNPSAEKIDTTVIKNSPPPGAVEGGKGPGSPPGSRP